MRDEGRRFAVPLSFPGERRALVKEVAGSLAARFGRDRILHDEFHEAESAKPDLEVHKVAFHRIHYWDVSEMLHISLRCNDHSLQLSGIYGPQLRVALSSDIGPDARWTSGRHSASVLRCQSCSDTRANGSSFTRTKETRGNPCISMHARGNPLRSSGWNLLPGVAEAYDLTSHELHELLDVAMENKERIARYWNEHFGD